MSWKLFPALWYVQRMIVKLAERDAPVNPERLLSGFQPTPRFREARFETYRPNPDFASQSAALHRLEEFGAVRSQGFKLFKRREILPSVYLDGGFGVGKTHLLAATWHAFQGTKFLLSFAELTFTIGALGMDAAVKAFSGTGLICVDEFELDDVGNTLMVSRFLAELIPRGVRFVTTSNTLPEQLGEGRFNADDFKREIQGIADRFETLRVDGPDYRHREGLRAPSPISGEALRTQFEAFSGVKALERLDGLLAHLAKLHPIRYSSLLEGLDAVFLEDLHAIPKQDDALRFVHLIDKLYDREIRLFVSGTNPDTLFPAAYKNGGYAKKYARCVSRLGELMRESSGADSLAPATTSVAS
jgi:cell division protein ZapE